MARRAILADAFIMKWAEHFDFDPRATRRVIIDATCGEVLQIYVEQFGSEDLLSVEPPDVSPTDIQVISKREAAFDAGDCTCLQDERDPTCPVHRTIP